MIVDPLELDRTPSESLRPSGSVWRRGIAGAVLLSVLLRLRFVFSPITADEGGFLAIARAWRHGATLYRDVWVDRPQGLLLTYRAYDVLSFGHTGGLRVIALVFGVIAVVAVGWAVRFVATPTAGLVAAVLTAALSASPAIEGFAANGELLSGAIGAVGVALAVGVLSGRLSHRWMVGAGVAAGVAFSLKQSGIDGAMAVVVWLAAMWLTRQMPRREALVRLAQFGGGAAAVVALLVVHGALTDWHDFSYALLGYRLDQRSALVGADWSRLAITWGAARFIVLPGLMVALIATVQLWYRRLDLAVGQAAGVLLVWPFTGLLMFLSGGQFFEHYWVILTFPLAAFAGVAIGAVPNARLRLGLVALAVLPAAISFVHLAVLSRDQIPVAVGRYHRSTKEEAVGEWFREVHAPGQTLYAFCASAAAYAHAHEDPPYPYLWIDNVNKVPGAVARLETYLSGPTRPTYIARFEAARNCGGQPVADQLDRNYHLLGEVGGVEILEVND